MRLSSLLVARAQAAYYVATGVWPFVSLSTFFLVTGPKTDVWLVHTVGALVTAIGLVAWRTGRPRPAEALALGLVESWYALRGVISPVYLGDAVVEAAIIVAWWVARKGEGRRSPRMAHRLRRRTSS